MDKDLRVRVTPAFLRQIKDRADTVGVGVSEWVRGVLVAALAKKRRGRKGFVGPNRPRR